MREALGLSAILDTYTEERGYPPDLPGMVVALSDLFVEVSRLCRAAGLVQIAHVAVDGTKLKANASRQKAMSYGRMTTAETALAAEVAGWLDQARDIDAAGDQAHGAARRRTGFS